ncbi:MAG TPA: ABC transporter permease [Candidatus Pelethocola excrementipullorum]|nr:ABC transporter permease [Candidatus Pelethocola excrementipullorum]
MFRLIKNELVKVFSKISTYLMLGIILIFVVGMSLLMKKSYQYSGHQYIYDRENIQYEIEYLESSKPQGYELELNRFKYMKDSGKEWRTDSWQLDALEEAFLTWQSPLVYDGDKLSEEQKKQYQSNFDKEMAPVLQDDWNAYATQQLKKIEEGADSDGVKAAKGYYYNYMIEQKIQPDSDDWREAVARRVAANGTELEELKEKEAKGDYVSEDNKEQLQNALALSEYRLEHNLSTYMDENGNTDNEFWNSFKEGRVVLTFVSVVLIVLAGGCVANEFSTGTIKFLLVNPVKRGKIIISKYLTLILLSIALIFFLYGFTALVDLIVQKTPDLGMPLLKAAGGVVSVESPWIYLLGQYLLGGVNLLAMTTMAFMISSLLRNSAVAIGIGVAALMGGNVLVMILAQFGQDWGRYVLFANLDLGGISQGYGMFPNQTSAFAIGTILVYMVIFLVTAYDAFTRSEV